MSTLSSGDAGAVFARIAEEMEADPAVTTGKMFGSPGLKVGGKVFAMLVKGRLVLKLPRERVDALVAAGAGEYFDPGHGRVMREWVSLHSSAGGWSDLVREAKASVVNGG